MVDSTSYTVTFQAQRLIRAGTMAALGGYLNSPLNSVEGIKLNYCLWKERHRKLAAATATPERLINGGDTRVSQPKMALWDFWSSFLSLGASARSVERVPSADRSNDNLEKLAALQEVVEVVLRCFTSDALDIEILPNNANVMEFADVMKLQEVWSSTDINNKYLAAAAHYTSRMSDAASNPSSTTESDISELLRAGEVFGPTSLTPAVLPKNATLKQFIGHVAYGVYLNPYTRAYLTKENKDVILTFLGNNLGQGNASVTAFIRETKPRVHQDIRRTVYYTFFQHAFAAMHLFEPSENFGNPFVEKVEGKCAGFASGLTAWNLSNSTFEYAKMSSVTLSHAIDNRKTGELSSLGRVLRSINSVHIPVCINVTEALCSDKVPVNAMAGRYLIEEAAKIPTNSHVDPVYRVATTPPGKASTMARGWFDLYVAWNLGFVTSLAPKDYLMYWGKLLNPMTSVFHSCPGWEGIGLHLRVVTLRLHILCGLALRKSVGFNEATSGTEPPNSLTPISELRPGAVDNHAVGWNGMHVAQIMGEINLNSAKRWLERDLEPSSFPSRGSVRAAAAANNPALRKQR